MNFLCVILIVFSLCACQGSTRDAEWEADAEEAPNILLIIADDVSKDALSFYSEGAFKANTPTLDRLANEGLVFDNLWVYPTCTPTRAALITGKYGLRTGVEWVGDILNDPEKMNLSEGAAEQDVILQQFIQDGTQAPSGYATAVIGKWHLAGSEQPLFNPEALGIDYYSGLISGSTDYYNWPLSENGESTMQSAYITQLFTDKAIEWVNDQVNPWFLWLAYTAPHTPFHVPPDSMHSQGDLPDYDDTQEPLPYYLAALEAMDFQIGRLLDNIPQDELDKTVLLFLADNGAPRPVAQYPYSNMKSKASLYQGGINTPMVVSGYGVSREGRDGNLINATDFFATIAELAGVEMNGGKYFDSRSFKSLLAQEVKVREFQYSEMNDSITEAWTVSNGRFKLIEHADGTHELYDLLDDPYEMLDLVVWGADEAVLEQRDSLRSFKESF